MIAVNEQILSWIQNEKFNIDKQPLIIFFIVLYKYHISPFLKQRQRQTYYNGVIKPHPPIPWYGIATMSNIFKVF